MMLALVPEEVQALRVVELALDDIDLILGSRLAGEVKPAFQSKTVGRVAALEIPELLKIELLERTRSDKAVPELLKAPEDPNSDFRSSETTALHNLVNVGATPGLLKEIEDPEYSVREGETAALENLGSVEEVSGLLVEAVPSLLKALEDPDPKVRRSAAEALGKLGSMEAIPGLLKALEDPDPDVRWIAVLPLGNLGNMEAIPGLLKALEDPDSDVRWVAAMALGNLGNVEAIPSLLKVLEDPDSNVCWSVTEALGNLGSVEAIPGLLRAIEHSAYNIRCSATEILGNLGSMEAIPGLLKALEDPDSHMRWIAAMSLGNLGSVEAVPGLLKAIEDPDSDVRRMGAEASEKLGSSLLLATLWRSRLKEPKADYLKDAIASIQSRCKFYNYEIASGIIPSGQAIEVFFSYAPKDQDLRDALETHLSLLERQKIITSWHDQKILPGTDRAQVINHHLNTANIILLLISANSLASDNCYDIEIRRSLERHHDGEARVIPILLRPVDYQNAIFSRLPMLPANGKFVTQWDNQDEAFEAIAQGIREAVMEIRRRA